MSRIKSRLGDEPLTAADRYLGALLIESAYRNGATRTELVRLAIDADRPDVARFFLNVPEAATEKTP